MRGGRARVAVAAVLLAALAATGCGGGSDDDSNSGPPKPRESLRSVVDDYRKAAEEQDCRLFARFEHSVLRPAGKSADDPPDERECAILFESLRRLQGVVPGRVKEFGTAGLVEAKVQGRDVALLWVLDVDRRWKQVQAAPDGPPGQLAARRRPNERFAQNAAAWVAAERAGDCRKVFRLFHPTSPFVTQDEGDRRRFCDRFERGRRMKSSLPSQLSRDPAAKAVDLGGTHDFHFFGIETRAGGYWTVLMAALPGEIPRTGHADQSVLDYYPSRRAPG